MDFSSIPNNNGEAFAHITKPGSYKGRLVAIRESMENMKFVEEGKEPRKLVSFVFDVLNKEGASVHVASKAMSATFTDKSSMPKFWNNVAKLTNGKDLQTFLFNNPEELKEMYLELSVSVQTKGDKTYNTVEGVFDVTDPTDQKATKVTSYDLKVYGVPCDEYVLTKDYKTATDNA